MNNSQTLHESLVLQASIIYVLFYFISCLFLVKSLKLEMGKYKVVQLNMSSEISTIVSAIFQKFSWLNFSYDHHKSIASIPFPFSLCPHQTQATLLT